jgi:hypothetical protein
MVTNRCIIRALILSLGTSCLTAGPAFVSACDLNYDGVVNVSDIQLAINQALGIVPCTSADLNGDGQCNVLDVQRVVDAALGEGCKVGNGASWYVSPAGSDTNSCTQSSPCRQISRVLTIVHPGDTIFVADGTYNAFTVSALNGTATNPISIQALAQNAQILPVTGVRDTIFVTFSSYIVLDGLRSFNANRAAVRIDNSPNVTVQNGVYGDNAEWGIFTDFSNNSLIRNNECYGSVAQHGIYVSNSSESPIVRANWLHDNAGCGLQLNADVTQGGSGIITGALLEDNIIYNNGSAGGAGINLDGVQYSTIQNNLLYNNHASGIAMFQIDGAAGPVGNLVYNNTIDMASDGRWDLEVSSSVGGNTVRDNIFYNENPNHGGIQYGAATDVANTNSAYNIFGGGNWGVTPDGGNTFLTLAEWQAQGYEPHSFIATSASLWVNPAAGNYLLLPGSPAINAGQALPSVTTDLNGAARSAGPASDIGCYGYPD